MANVDRPNGFRPVKTLSGRPMNAMIRTITPGAADIFIGDLLEISGGAASPASTPVGPGNALGVAVGFGKVDPDGIPLGMYEPENAYGGKRYFDSSEEVEADWVVYYVPVNDVVFEVQTASALDLAIGANADLVAGTGSTVTGRSGSEIGASTNADFIVVEKPHYPDNDPTLVNGRYWVTVADADQALR